ncbi:MAG: hypothetical protein RLZZ419_1687 [Pseudomonadota bacterium]|jgi:peptidoglycan/xylan/chitin deacetylase (PgdA/CDA1 family)
MRVDRLLSQYLFGPLKGRFRGGGLKIPILMYHSIAGNTDDHLHPYYRTVTTPETFAMQMAFLSRSGYRTLTLFEAVGLLQGEANHQPLGRSVVITFDDGFQDFYSAAFPVLEQFGFKATVFLISALIGKTFVTGRQCLNAEEIRELSRNGIEFGSHTVSHPQLKNLSNAAIADELADSKVNIEDLIGVPVFLFSYPYRFPEEDSGFTRNLGALLIDAGYTAGVTTSIGLASADDDILFLKRLPVNDNDDLVLFKIKLEGGYDWLHPCQLAYKKSRVKYQKWTAS